MKKFLSIILLLSIVLSLCPMVTVSATEDGWTMISNASELYSLMNSNKSGKFKLANDINLATYGTWRPIGTKTSPFKGTLDGNGYSILNLSLSSGSGSEYTGSLNIGHTWVGLFGYATNSNISNLKITVSSCDAKGNSYVYCGGLIGYDVGSKISNVYVSGSTLSASPGTATWSYHGGSVGGIVGVASSTTILTDVHNSCSTSIPGDYYNVYAGGITGQGGVISKSTNKGSIRASGFLSDGYVGGISGSSATISECKNTGSVSLSISSHYGSGTYAGGIIGSGSNVTNCYNTGSVSCSISSGSTGYSTAGGISGNSTDVTNCYSTGSVSASTLKTQKYYISSVGNVTADDMNNISKYKKFDFNSVWIMTSLGGYNYPQLRCILGKEYELPDANSVLIVAKQNGVEVPVDGAIVTVYDGTTPLTNEDVTITNVGSGQYQFQWHRKIPRRATVSAYKTVASGSPIDSGMRDELFRHFGYADNGQIERYILELHSETIDKKGNWCGVSFDELSEQGNVLLLKEPRMKVNLAVAYYANDENSISNDHYEKIKNILKEYSLNLAQATDGHIMLNKVIITNTDNRENFYIDNESGEHPIQSMADIRIETLDTGTNGEKIHSNANPGGFWYGSKTAEPYTKNFVNISEEEINLLNKKKQFRRMQFGFRDAASSGNILNSYTVMHETGHYLLYLLDEYLNGDDKEWTEDVYYDFNKYHPRLEGMPDNFGLMEYQWAGDIELSKSYDYIYNPTEKSNHTANSYLYNLSAEGVLALMLNTGGIAFSEDYSNENNLDTRAEILFEKGDYDISYSLTKEKDRTVQYPYAELIDENIIDLRNISTQYSINRFNNNSVQENKENTVTNDDSTNQVEPMAIRPIYNSVETDRDLADVKLVGNELHIYNYEGNYDNCIFLMDATDEDWGVSEIDLENYCDDFNHFDPYDCRIATLDFDEVGIYKLYVVLEENSEAYHNVYYVNKYIDESGNEGYALCENVSTDGYFYESEDNRVMGYVIPEEDTAYSFIASNDNYTNGEYSSVNQATTILCSNDNVSSKGELYSVAGIDNDIDYSSISWFVNQAGEWNQLETRYYTEENNNIGATCDFAGDGLYVLMAKKADSTALSPVTDIKTTEGALYDTSINITFNDTNENTAYYRIYCSEESFDNINDAENYVMYPKNSSNTYTLNLSKANASFYCGIVAVADDGSSSVLSDIVNLKKEYDDSDNDGIPDYWCSEYQLWDLDDIANSDSDSDGLTNLEEFNANTNPKNPDTDSDCVNDGKEIELNLNPLAKKTDGTTPDGHIAYGEVNISVSNVSIETNESILEGSCDYTIVATLKNNSNEAVHSLPVKLYADGELLYEYSFDIEKNSTRKIAYICEGQEKADNVTVVIDEEGLFNNINSNNSGSLELENQLGLNLVDAQVNINTIQLNANVSNYYQNITNAYFVIDAFKDNEKIGTGYTKFNSSLPSSITVKGNVRVPYGTTGNVIIKGRLCSDSLGENPISTNEIETSVVLSEIAVTDSSNFEFDKTTQTITDYIGTDSMVVIPESIDGVDVLSIGQNTFSSNSNIVAVVVPSSVTSIANNAFTYCTNLVNVEILDGCKEIGNNAFYRCTNLANITVPNTVESVGRQAFLGTKWLTNYPGDYVIVGKQLLINYKGNDSNVSVPMGVKEIMPDAFRKVISTSYTSNTAITNILLPESIERIYDYAFYQCTNLKSINVPENVTKIGNYAFANCAKLESIVLPSELETLGTNVFYNCSSLASCELPNNIKEIPSYFFSGCTALEYIEIPQTVEMISQYAFQNCDKLVISTFDENVKTIGNYAFSGCDAILNITIPDEIQLGTYVFNGCVGLKSVDLQERTSVPSRSFNGCTSLTSVSMAKVEEIGSYAFNGCTALTEIVLPESTTKISTYAFAECTALKKIEIPKSVTTIESNAFNNCTNLVIYGAFDSYAYTYATENSIQFMFTEPIKCGDNVYMNINSDYTVTISGSGDMYDYTNYTLVPWYKIASKIKSVTTEEGVTSIGDYSFYRCTLLTDVKLPSTLNSIGANSFGYCSRLTSIELPEKLSNIGTQAFMYCNLLTLIELSDNVENIGNAAFSYCRKLESINVQENNSNYCSINGILYTKNKTELIQYPIAKTDEEFAIPETVEKIWSRAFQGCLIQTLKLPVSVTYIDTYAFTSCSNLSKIFYYGTQSDYEAIDKTSGNTILDNDIVSFEFNESLPIGIKTASAYYDSDSSSVNVTVVFDYIFSDGEAFVAIYDKDNKLIKVISSHSTISDTSLEIPVPIEKFESDYKVKVFFWEGLETLKPLSKVASVNIEENIVVDTVLQSAHPYANNANETKTYTYDGICSSIDVTFSADTLVENSYDKIYILDGNDKQIGVYTGSELAGVTVNIPGNKFKIKLTSDGSVTKYGYRTERIIVNK